jgi:hypothetical protein
LHGCQPRCSFQCIPLPLGGPCCPRRAC